MKHMRGSNSINSFIGKEIILIIISLCSGSLRAGIANDIHEMI